MESLIFDRICTHCHLGPLTGTPTPLSGGFLHRMVALPTASGRYAVKLLNPFIMQRPDALDNYRTAEALEARLEEAHLPILPALTFHGQKMQQVDGQYFYVFPWCAGRSLRDSEITVAHCERIGRLLARMHGLDRRPGPVDLAPMDIDWDAFLRRYQTHNPELYRLLHPHRDLLYRCQAEGNGAQARLPAVTAICHNDMDSKNVLWLGDECRVIDLECLGYANPVMEMYEMALSWSGCEDGALAPVRLRHFVQAYAEAGGVLPEDWDAVYHACTNRLNWLHYNVRRSLGLDCSPEEIPLGAGEVRATLKKILYYAQVKETILHALRPLTNQRSDPQ